MSSLLRRLGSATAPLRLVTAATITKQVALAPTFSRLSVAQTNRAYSSGKKVPLTSDRLGFERLPFSKLTEEDVKVFREILKEAGPVSVLTDSADVEGFNEVGNRFLKYLQSILYRNEKDWMRKFRGQSQLVLKPKTTQQVSEILKYANQRQLAVVTQGGNTGLVGGSVPVFDEIVLSTSNMNSIQSFDETAGILTCQAGCILEVLDGWLAEKGYAMPLDLGAKGTCQI
ncbi:hypothetical protein HDU99_006073, partial [Rhizoclosmatium hyalinum]